MPPWNHGWDKLGTEHPLMEAGSLFSLLHSPPAFLWNQSSLGPTKPSSYSSVTACPPPCLCPALL